MKLSYFTIFLFSWQFIQINVCQSFDSRGRIGCLYSDICQSDEICFDDKLFGSCYIIGSENNVIEYSGMSIDFMKVVEELLGYLKEQNLSWNSDYSQCLMQNLLKSYKMLLFIDISKICERYNTVYDEPLNNDDDIDNYQNKYLLQNLNDDETKYNYVPIKGDQLLKEKIDAPIVSAKQKIFTIEKKNSLSLFSRDPDIRIIDKSWIWFSFENLIVNETLAQDFVKLLQIRYVGTFSPDNYKIKDRNRVYVHVAFDSLTPPDTVVHDFEKNFTLIPGFAVADVGFGITQLVSEEELHGKFNKYQIPILFSLLLLLSLFFCFLIHIYMKRYIKNEKKRIFGDDLKNEESKTREDQLTGLIVFTDDKSVQNYEDLCRKRMKERCQGDVFSPNTAASAHKANAPMITSEHSSLSSWSEEPVKLNIDITSGHAILSYMESILTDKERIDREWNSICEYEAENRETSVATSEMNQDKNRTMECVPYDFNRVILDKDEYINASNIIDSDPKKYLYIATQGPLVNTVKNFWQMVWQKNIFVIVNLTNLLEDGITLCHKYWPEQVPEIYEDYEVYLVSEHIWCESYLVRNLFIKNLVTGESRTVTQFHFTQWLEQHLPHNTNSFLSFMRKVNKACKNQSSPVIVHCSDGSGRTGTYILIDMILQRLGNKSVKELDLAATIEHLRDQRLLMVRTKDQFEFALSTIAEEIQSMLKVISSTH